MDTLIERLRQRAHDPALATDLGADVMDRKGNSIPYMAHAPLSEQDIAREEQRIGFALPALLRELYLQIGDGGFGPGYGLYRLKDCSVSGLGQYLEICHWGCGITSLLDCSQPAAPVLRLDPNMSEGILETSGSPLIDIEDYVVLQERDSLEDWLEAWAAGQELFMRPYGISAEDVEEG